MAEASRPMRSKSSLARLISNHYVVLADCITDISSLVIAIDESLTGWTCDEEEGNMNMLSEFAEIAKSDTENHCH